MDIGKKFSLLVSLKAEGKGNGSFSIMNHNQFTAGCLLENKKKSSSGSNIHLSLPIQSCKGLTGVEVTRRELKFH